MNTLLRANDLIAATVQPAPKAVIALHDVSKAFAGRGAAQSVRALDKVSFGARRGDVFGVIGAVGGGGLGDLGIRYGYQRFMPDVMAAVVVVLIALVQGVQTIGDRLARRLNKRAPQGWAETQSIDSKEF